MSTTSIVMLLAHGTIFFIVRYRINAKKKVLSRDNAQLTTDNRRLKGQLQSLLAELSDD